MADLFADTYALVEILKGNPKYEKYSERMLTTTEFNIFELAYALYRDFGDDAVNTLRLVRDEVAMEYVGDDDYIEASKIRLITNKKGKNLNMLNIPWILNADIQRGKIINNINFICSRDCNGVY